MFCNDKVAIFITWLITDLSLSMLTLMTWLRLCLSAVLLRRKPPVQPNSFSVSSVSLPWVQNIYVGYLEFFHVGHLSLFLHLFIYYIIYLCQYGLTDIYLHLYFGQFLHMYFTTKKFKWWNSYKNWEFYLIANTVRVNWARVNCQKSEQVFGHMSKNVGSGPGEVIILLYSELFAL